MIPQGFTAEGYARWQRSKLIVIYDPRTGITKPWEVRLVSAEGDVNRHWGSFKTKEAAEKRAEKGRKDYAKKGLSL